MDLVYYHMIALTFLIIVGVTFAESEAKKIEARERAIKDKRKNDRFESVWNVSTLQRKQSNRSSA